jgi:hypothetical protein
MWWVGPGRQHLIISCSSSDIIKQFMKDSLATSTYSRLLTDITRYVVLLVSACTDNLEHTPAAMHLHAVHYAGIPRRHTDSPRTPAAGWEDSLYPFGGHLALTFCQPIPPHTCSTDAGWYCTLEWSCRDCRACVRARPTSATFGVCKSAQVFKRPQ